MASLSSPIILTKLDRAWSWAFKLWLSCEIAFLALTALVSSFYPILPEERTTSIWPMTAPLQQWLERIVLLPIKRYDVNWYLDIAQYWYGHELGDTAFHPLLPWLMAMVGRFLGGSPSALLLAGWLIAQICTMLLLVVFYKLILLDYDHGVARRATLFLMISPLGFVFLLPYTEALLLMSMIAALYAARTGHWWLAGLAGAAAALTKQPGVSILFCLLWELWQSWKASPGQASIKALIRPLLGLSLIPLSLLFWIIYRATIGDTIFSITNPGSYMSLFVTPAGKEVWNGFFSWPWVQMIYALEQLQTRPTLYLAMQTLSALIMTALAFYSLGRMRLSYTIYTIIFLLMNLSVVIPDYPYMSIMRRFTIVFPIFLYLGIRLSSPRIKQWFVVANMTIWALISYLYVRNAFVP